MLTLKTKPYEFQKLAIKKGSDSILKNGIFGNLLAMGTGKSLTTMSIASNLSNKNLINALLIIAPKQTCSTWQDEELPKHLSCNGKQIPTLLWNGQKSKTQKYQAEFQSLLQQPFCAFIVNIETFQSLSEIFIKQYLKPFLAQRKVFCILDESSRIKSPKAERSKNLTKLLSSAPYKSILTGTFITESAMDAYQQMEFLQPGFWLRHTGIKNDFVFKHKYCIVEKGYGPGGRTFDRTLKASEMKPAQKSLYQQNLDAINKIIEPYIFRIKKEECFDLPPTIWQSLKCDLGAEESRVYDDLKHELISTLSDGTEIAITRKMTLFMKLRQVIGGFIERQQLEKSLPSKLTAMIADIEETDEQIAVFANFTSEIKLITQELSKIDTCAAYYGEVGQDEKNQAKESFQKGDTRFLVLNPASGAYSLNLQNCSLVYWYGLPLSSEQYTQALDRFRRLGMKKSVTFKPIICNRPIDTHIQKLLDAKIDIMTAFSSWTKAEVERNL